MSNPLFTSWKYQGNNKVYETEVIKPNYIKHFQDPSLPLNCERLSMTCPKGNLSFSTNYSALEIGFKLFLQQDVLVPKILCQDKVLTIQSTVGCSNLVIKWCAI